MTTFTALPDRTRPGFTAPSFAIFTDLLNGWVLAPGRRTITAMIAVADPTNLRTHDAYHRFVRDGCWSMPGLWQVPAVQAVEAFCPTEVVSVDLDDTLFHKSGREIDGAGVFWDAVRSTARRVVYATGLNLVVVTLRVNPPWGGMPIGLPINARPHRKHDPVATVTHAAAMLRQLADWPPGQTLQVCADGAYSSLAGAALPRTHYTGRMRHDAALFEATPPTDRQARPTPPARRTAPHPTRTCRGTRQDGLAIGHPGRPRHPPHPAGPPPGRALVRGLPHRPGPARHRPRPERDRTRGLFLQHRPDRHWRRARVALRRPVEHRGHLPRHQTRPRG